MDSLKNPFSPGAGNQPPELAGRSEVLAQIETSLARVKAGAFSRSSILVGLRGVGKTVLLNKAFELAGEFGYQSLFVEAHEDKSLPALLAPQLRGLLLRLNSQGFTGKTQRALRVFKSFVSGAKLKFNLSGDFGMELGIDAEPGAADSGDLEHDLGELLVATAEAAASKSVPVALFIDELQYLSEVEMSALIMGLHRISQRNLPLTMYAAGLPLVLALAGRSKSYAERLFSFPAIGVLDRQAGRQALVAPLHAAKVSIEESALEAILRTTERYPYFLQQWGYESWNAASGSPITAQDVEVATGCAIRQLDESFFRVRFDRLSKREKEFLFAMVRTGSATPRSGDIADQLGIKPTSLGPLRSSLIRKGMIYSPAHGDNAFTVPLFNEFLKRQIGP